MNADLPITAHARLTRVEPGVRLGSYEILMCIARGGMASVWAARQHGARGSSRLVALKTILPELSAPDLEVMFLDEARVTGRIRHPNVCEVFELIEHQGVLALSMEWVDGETLHNVLCGGAKVQALDARLAAQIVAHVASGLHAAHELRDDEGDPLELVHRDVSPQNILISRAGHVKVTDFGVAKSLGGAREATAVGKVKGKLSYMSPEQAQGKPIDRRSDIFSLGIVLYLASTGAHPFRRPGESRHQQLSRLVTNRFERPSQLVPGYPRELEAIVLRALAHKPAARFASAREMARSLQAFVLATGPAVSDSQIARALLERCGAPILERSERIANMMCRGREARPSAPPAPAAEPTLVPTTTSRLVHALAAERVQSARATLRVLTTTLTAAAIGLAASAVFSPAPSAAPAASAPAPAAAPPPAAADGAASPPAPAAPVTTRAGGRVAADGLAALPAAPPQADKPRLERPRASVRRSPPARARGAKAVVTKPKARKPSGRARPEPASSRPSKKRSGR